ncbi:MAG: C25 family cysteine peptidase, partial [Fidelibacterota bacterium]
MKNERSIPTAINSRNVFTLVLSLVRRLISLLPGAPRLPQFQRRPARINPATPFRFLLIPYLVFLNLQAQPAERIQSRPGSLIIELSLDSVRVGLQGEIISSPALSQAYFSDGPLPVYQECFLQLPQDTRIQVFPGTVRSFPLDSPVVTVREQGKGAELEEPPSTPSPGADQWYSLDASPSNLGTLIRLYPIHRIGDEIFWTPHLSLLFTWPADGSPPAQPLSETRFSDQSRSPGSRSDWSGPPVPDYQFSSDLARINVDHKGWYGITYVDLVDSNVAITDVDPRTFRLWDGDRECPLIVEGEADGDFSSGDRIIFRGEPAPPPEGVAYRSNFYTSSHTYWLTWGGNPGRRYIEESAYPEAPLDEVHHPDSFRDTLHLESNDYFARLGSRNLHDEWDRFDHFFMNPPIQGGTSVDFNLEVDYPTSSMEQRFSLIAEFQGITNNTHQLQVTLNHLLLGSADWTGQDQLLFETDPGQQLPNSSLSHGDNVLTCTLSGDDPTNRYDQVYLNWVELIYDREFRAADNRLAFRRNSVLPMINQFQISGFTTANIYLVKDDLTRLTDFLIVPSDEGYTAVFQDYTASDRPLYRIFTGDQIESVRSLHPEAALTPLLTTISSDYLILAPDSFRVILQPLADFHGAQIIDIDNVYREYSGGQMDPHAIKAFLKQVWSQGPAGLRYVLIAMQGKWFGWEGSGGARQVFIPTMKIQTYGFGAVASDTWYTLVSGDDFLPDFAIGRFPAQNRAELETMVAKTMNYLTRGDLSSDNRLLMIGGYEATFKSQSESLIDPI